MTEWQLQEHLTRRWEEDGIVLPGGELLQLVAWEIMVKTRRVNDAHRHWNESSLDFLAVDRARRPVAIELKMRLTGTVRVWRAVCQVTARTLALAASGSDERLSSVRQACRSGVHGRASPRSAPDGEDWPVNLEANWRRVVAAPVVDDDKVRAAAAHLGDNPVEAAKDWLDRFPHQRKVDLPVRRLAEIQASGERPLTEGVETLPVGIDGESEPPHGA
jgi:hypothetical protein